MTCLKAGDEDGHNRLIYKAGYQLSEKGCDTIILSQTTMVSAAEIMLKSGLRVLSSPKLGAEAMVRLIRQKGTDC